MDDVERLLRRQDEADDDATRDRGAAGAGSPVILGKTTTVGTYPTTAGRYYWITPNDVTGAETEGGTGTLTGLSGRFLALNIGSAIPPSGTAVLCTWIGNRWVFNY